MQVDIPLKLYAKLKLMEFDAKIKREKIEQLLKENNFEELERLALTSQECDAKA